MGNAHLVSTTELCAVHSSSRTNARPDAAQAAAEGSPSDVATLRLEVDFAEQKQPHVEALFLEIRGRRTRLRNTFQQQESVSGDKLSSITKTRLKRTIRITTFRK